MDDTASQRRESARIRQRERRNTSTEREDTRQQNATRRIDSRAILSQERHACRNPSTECKTTLGR